MDDRKFESDFNFGEDEFYSSSEVYENPEVEKSEDIVPEPKKRPQVPKRKRKKRKKKRYLLKFCITLILLGAVYVFLSSSFFDISEIKIYKNEHYTPEQIVEISGVKKGDNLFKLSSKKLEEKMTSDPYISMIEMKKVYPDKLEIVVHERTEDAIIKYKEKYLVIDYNGMVLRTADKAPKLTEIVEMDVIKARPGQALKVEDTQILTDTLNLLKSVNAQDMYFKKVEPHEIILKAYIYDNLICEGTYDSIGDNLESLKIVLQDLHKDKIKRGTIKVSGNGYCSFRPEIDTK